MLFTMTIKHLRMVKKKGKYLRKHSLKTIVHGINTDLPRIY